MTIGIDIRVLTRGTHSGVEEYTANLLSSMINLAPHIRFKLFLNSFSRVDLNDDWIKSPNVSVHKFNIPNKILFPSLWALGSPKIDRLIGGADVFFSPHFFVAPVSKSCRRVITFHDLSFIRYPEFFSFKQRIWHYLQKPHKQAQKADSIIAVSNSTKADLVDLFGVKPDKVNVVYSGIDSRFFNFNDGEQEKTKQKYNLPDNYILFLGTFEPRKNLIGIIKAFEILCRNNKFKDYYLILVGNKGWLSEEVFRALDYSRLKQKIIYLGPIANSDRPAIYRNSKLFVYPSFFEGFGFPPVEAMASGIPVITSHTSSLPEVVGESALMIDPYNTEEIADAMAMILSDNKIYRNYVEKGKKRASQFSWQKTAQETLRALTLY